MAQLPIVSRRYYLTMFEDGLLTPQPDSDAEHFFASVEFGPAGQWPAMAASQPSLLAAKLLRQQSDYLAAIGTLLLAGEVFDPIMTLLRGAFEYGARGAWIMDPAVTHRVRCIRAVLTEVVSLETSRRAAGKMPASEPEQPRGQKARRAGRGSGR